MKKVSHSNFIDSYQTDSHESVFYYNNFDKSLIAYLPY